MAHGSSRDPFRCVNYTVRVMIIDPFNEEIRDADIAPTLQSFQKASGGDLRFSRWISASDVLFVCNTPERPERFVTGDCSISGCGDCGRRREGLGNAGARRRVGNPGVRDVLTSRERARDGFIMRVVVIDPFNREIREEDEAVLAAKRVRTY
jgi:hypothetical protein